MPSSLSQRFFAEHRDAGRHRLNPWRIENMVHPAVLGPRKGKIGWPQSTILGSQPTSFGDQMGAAPRALKTSEIVIRTP